jgi:hypothetical protein
MKEANKYSPLILIAVILILVTLPAGCSQAEPPDPGAITGRVYLDEDADAECDICDCDFYLEDIEILLYEGNCGGVIHQSVETDEEGVFGFDGLVPGNYCVTPKVKTICEGYKPTTPIQQKIIVVSNETAEVPWFGFDHNLDIRE